jgi:hypothetical protein
MIELTPDELHLLQWLGESDFSHYGECYGRSLDRLVALGLAQIHGPGEHQVFIARPTPTQIAQGEDQMYRAVSLTRAGEQELDHRLGTD